MGYADDPSLRCLNQHPECDWQDSQGNSAQYDIFFFTLLSKAVSFLSKYLGSLGIWPNPKLVSEDESIMKRERKLYVIITTIAMVSTAALAHPPAGPEWGEDGDAGNSPGTAQTTMGIGSLGFISGSLGGTLSSGDHIDFEDMFLINIVNPMMFRATTDEMDGELPNAFALFNTQLWLFQPSGVPGNALGIVGNNDHPGTGSFQSLLTPIPDDGLPGVVAPGLYYIAITRFNNVPLSAGGEIFSFASTTEISGPDGPGGLMPFSLWSGDEGLFNGEYRIALRGAEFAEIPTPGTLPILVLGLLGIARRRRR